MDEPNLRELHGEAAPEATLRDILVPLFRHRRLMALSFFGIFLGGILTALLLANQYEAHFKVLVKRERVDPVVSSEASPQTSQAAPPVTEEEINSEVELLRSDDVLQKVVLASGLQDKKQSWFSALVKPKEDAETSVAKAVQGLAKQLQIEAVKKTDLIEVSYQSTDPQSAYRVLNALANSYLEKHLAVHRPPGAFDFFQQETEQYRDRLAAANVRLGNFIQEKKIANAVGERDLTLQDLSKFDATLHETETGIAETQRRIGDLEAQLKVTPARMSTAQKASNVGVATLELKHTDMVAHYDSDSQTIFMADNPIGHKVEFSEVPHAFSGSASSVTIRGLIIEKYATPAQSGAIHALSDPGPLSHDWLVEENEVRNIELPR